MDLCRSEHDALRKELIHLRWTQIQFFTFAITSTLVYFGIILRGGEISFAYFRQSVVTAVLSFLPLIILIPSMWIFFDKAKTISRIIGYHLILEDILLGKRDAPGFTGWENGLRIFRRHIRELENDSQTVREKIASIREIGTTGGNITEVVLSNRGYMVVVFLVFAIFIAICLSPMILYTVLNGREAFLFNAPAVCLGLFILALSLLFISYEYRTLKHLFFGKYTDLANREKWDRILVGEFPEEGPEGHRRD